VHYLREIIKALDTGSSSLRNAMLTPSDNGLSLNVKKRTDVGVGEVENVGYLIEL